MFRLLLAFAVFATHAGIEVAGLSLGNPRIAVQAFFMISGFLISYVLNRDGAYTRLSTFYVNRALRIFPIYWCVAAATAVVWLTFAEVREPVGLNPAALLLVAVTNVIVVGQDFVIFVQQNGDGLAFSRDFHLAHPSLWELLTVPPAWSLALELYFYLLAPWLVRRVGLMVAVAIGSTALTVIGWQYGLDNDPWTYRFFPFEISLFVAGALAERWLLPLVRTHATRSSIVAAPGVAVGVYLAQGWVPLPEPASTIGTLAILWGLLPFLFLFQHGRTWDVALGDLSYPLYICHWLVLTILQLRPFGASLPPAVPHVLAIPAVLLVSVVLERYVARPVERVRRRIRGHEAPLYSLALRRDARSG
ncbi:acyltransferase [Sphingomonas sp. RB3P16]|uniref:acyltransferase family protein n=1 Tax=Parasphingomonas frigoris TaxID=3096163 RepID=UPI002FCB2554